MIGREPDGFRYKKQIVNGVESGFTDLFVLGETSDAVVFDPQYLIFSVQNRSASSIDLELAYQIEATDTGGPDPAVLNRKEFVSVASGTINKTFGIERFPEANDALIQPNREISAGYNAGRDDPDCDLIIYFGYTSYVIR
jgi:hypothetical protein